MAENSGRLSKLRKIIPHQVEQVKLARKSIVVHREENLAKKEVSFEDPRLMY